AVVSISLLILRQPPTSTLFPYTTLFRSNTVYDAICATVGAARSNSSTNGRRSTSSLGSDCNILVPPISPCQAKQKTPKPPLQGLDRKSTRLNSSHVKISYAVFCLKKKTR